MMRQIFNENCRMMSTPPKNKSAPAKKSLVKKKPAAKAVSPKKSAPEKKPRVRNPQHTRAKLLQATIDLLAAKGPDALSLKEAARVANVSRGVAYQHFTDRDHLLREAKAWMSDRLLESANEVQPALKEKDVDQVTHESVLHIAKLVLSNREAARLLIIDALAGKALEADHPIFKLVIRDLELLQASGKARSDIDIEILSFILLGSISTILMLSHSPNAGDIDSLAQRYTATWTRLIREGMLTKEAGKPVKKTAAKVAKPAVKKTAAKKPATTRSLTTKPLPAKARSKATKPR